MVFAWRIFRIRWRQGQQRTRIRVAPAGSTNSTCRWHTHLYRCAYRYVRVRTGLAFLKKIIAHPSVDVRTAALKIQLTSRNETLKKAFRFKLLIYALRNWIYGFNYNLWWNMLFQVCNVTVLAVFSMNSSRLLKAYF